VKEISARTCISITRISSLAQILYFEKKNRRLFRKTGAYFVGDGYGSLEAGA